MLLLDEPTNDLDVDTLRALEEALLDFAGCAVVITHDRWFLDRVATHILAFEGDSQATWFEGTFRRVRRLGDRDARRRGARAAPDQVQAARSLLSSAPRPHVRSARDGRQTGKRPRPARIRTGRRSAISASGCCLTRAATSSATGATRRSSSGRSRGGRTRSRPARTRSSPCDLRPARDRPRLGDDRAGARARLRTRHPPLRPRRLVQRRLDADAGARSLDGIPALPAGDALDLGLDRRRLPVRLLELHARARSRGTCT